jgi:voltage-gated potassium channel
MLSKNFIPPPVILLLLLVLLIFIVPFFPRHVTPGLYQLLFTAVIVASAFALENKKKYILVIAAIVIGIKWAILVYDQELRQISNIPMLLFFIWMVGRLLWRIANAPRKTSLVIIDCINGYFLMALVSAIFIGLTSYLSPGSFNFPHRGEAPIQGMNDYIYHALVVFSTTGFGDIIPNTPQAKAVSNFISVSGQLYVTIIITLVIGNYLSTKKPVSAKSEIK